MLTVRQSELLHSATKGSCHLHSIGLNCQLIASEGLQFTQQNFLSRTSHKQETLFLSHKNIYKSTPHNILEFY